jgi:hypothetical protein
VNDQASSIPSAAVRYRRVASRQTIHRRALIFGSCSPHFIMSEPAATSEPRAYWVRLSDGSEYGPGSIQLMAAWARDGRIPRSAVLVTRDGASPIPVTSEPAILEALDSPPPSTLTDIATSFDQSAVGDFVPYRNQAAMWGYWLSIAAIIPGLGLMLGPASVALGVVGLMVAKRFPKARGVSHSWVAIILGCFASLYNFAGIIAIVVRYWGKIKTLW